MSRMYDILDNIATKTAMIDVITISNGANKDIPIKSSTRGFFFVATYATQNAAIYSVGASSTGATAYNARIAPNSASALTLTTGTNKINVANSSGAVITIFCLMA